AAIWTGSEVIVWGGESDGHRNGLTTGAAYDPKTDSWRTIAPAPGRSGRGYPSTALADHWLVVGGGTKTPPGTDVLIYDLETDTWDEVELRDLDVQQVVATDDLVALVGVDPSLDPSGPKPQGADGRPTDRARTDRLLVRWLDPATRHLERAPDLTLAGQPAAVAAHWAGGALTAAVTTLVPVDGNPGGSNPGPGAVATVEPNSGWYRRRTIPPPTSLLEPVGFGYQLPTLWAWTGRSVVTVPLGSVATFDPETGVERVRHRQREDTEDIYPTGFDAAEAWTGSEVLLWGGESGSGGGELAIGARLRPEP
ncbi:MAG: hypothetical protein KF703_04075, partial [Actinobacteria bacterium]|nr:hypothetical protein [Actinomycetota bacterium]